MINESERNMPGEFRLNIFPLGEQDEEKGVGGMVILTRKVERNKKKKKKKKRKISYGLHDQIWGRG